jgi:cbb3-type cytochrome oxidase maturation protein
MITLTLKYLCGINQSMSVLYILIGASLLLAVGFLAAFIISVRSGQYDDDYTPSVRILFDDTKNSSSPKTKT